jgi:lactoylglutathione lyase
MNDKREGSGWEVVKNAQPRIRHTMLRVKNIEASIDFYTRIFEMTLFRRIDNEGGKYSVAFVGYGDENSAPAIELTYNWGQDEDYDKGDGFGHIAIGVPDIYGICEKIAAEGMEIPRPPGPLKHGGPNASVIAFVKDPDGYMIELGERA